MQNLWIPESAAECLRPMNSFYTFSLSKAGIFYGVPLGIANYCLSSVAFGPRRGIDVHR